MDHRDRQASSPHVKRVELPSGKTIDVIRFGGGADNGTELHLCPSCGSRLVHPTHWSEAGPSAWRLRLRCPECEHTHEGVFSQEAVQAFDTELDAGTDALARDLRRLTRANMAEEAERLASALAADAILPEDFYV
ncbi:MAG: hypothetical protein ACR2GL_03705 [Thermoleophilaceae bacterium]